jgi:hypothetical protein
MKKTNNKRLHELLWKLKAANITNILNKNNTPDEVDGVPHNTETYNQIIEELETDFNYDVNDYKLVSHYIPNKEIENIFNLPVQRYGDGGDTYSKVHPEFARMMDFKVGKRYLKVYKNKDGFMDILYFAVTNSGRVYQEQPTDIYTFVGTINNLEVYKEF